MGSGGSHWYRSPSAGSSWVVPRVSRVFPGWSPVCLGCPLPLHLTEGVDGVIRAEVDSTVADHWDVALFCVQVRVQASVRCRINAIWAYWPQTAF